MSQFGEISSYYNRGRKGVPDGCFQLLGEYVGANQPILDLGCGTGISTRQLKSHGFNVQGCDIDEKMLAYAISKGDDIRYICAPSQNLPFDDQSFRAVTAFSSFHWFTDQKSLSEIKRVLQKAGIFFVVNKDDVSDFKHYLRQELSEFTKQDLPESKKNFAPLDLLKENGFKVVADKAFEMEDVYDENEALDYCRSISFWSHVKNKEEAEKAILIPFIKTLLKDGKMHRPVSVRCIVSEITKG